jgi:hypothetical protein
MESEADQIRYRCHSQDLVERAFKGTFTHRCGPAQVADVEMVASMRQRVVLRGLYDEAVSLLRPVAAGGLEVVGYAEGREEDFQQFDASGDPFIPALVEQSRLRRRAMAGRHRLGAGTVDEGRDANARPEG